MNHSFPQPNQNWEKNTMKIEWKHWWHENHLDKWKLRTFTFSEGFTTLNTFIRCRTDFICQILPVSNSKNSATCVNQTKAVPWKHYSSSPIQIQFSTPNNHRIPDQVNKISRTTLTSYVPLHCFRTICTRDTLARFSNARIPLHLKWPWSRQKGALRIPVLFPISMRNQVLREEQKFDILFRSFESFPPSFWIPFHLVSNYFSIALNFFPAV